MAISIALTIALVGASTPALAVPAKRGWHGLGWDLPPLQTTKSVPGGANTQRPTPRSESAEKAIAALPAVSWPKAATSEVDLSDKKAPAAGTPVSIGRAGKSDRAGRVKVDVLDRAASDRARIPGLLTRVSQASGDVSGSLAFDLDYSGVASAYGAGYGRRLTLVAYPDCVLSTPDNPACRVATPVKSANTEGKRLSGEITLPESTPKAGTASAERTASTMVVAAVAGASGGDGDMTATSLSPAGSWTGGGSSGAFNYDYPITLPSPPAGEAPGLSLNYSSAAVDGLTSATNNQASWVGDGWSMSAGGFIERSYKSCARDLGGNNGQTKTGDQCWATDNATLSLGESNGPLVKDVSTGAWHPKHDDGSRIEKLTGAANGALNGEYWKVTTTDGTQYFFGLNRLPGWAAGNPETGSAFTAPVFGNNPGEPCNQAAFANSWCQQAYRWNLDYVVDPNGNQIAFYYQPEINYYGRNLTTTAAGSTPYVRGGYLLRMEYGLNTKAGGAFAQAPARVVFDTAERCLPSGPITCDPAQLTTANAASWPDVPADQLCNQGAACPNVSPSYFTRKRLTTITTQAANGSGGWNNRDKWQLAHTFPASGDGSNPALWFDNIVHTGLAGGTMAMPPTTFGGTSKTNRTFASQNYTSLSRYRITSVVGELGGTLTADYSTPDCQGGAPDPATNTTRCYPVYWTPGGQENPVLDWFNKYVVTDVYSDGRTSLSAQNRTHYDYNGGGAWHFDENFLTDAAYRTWSQWRGYGDVTTTTGNPGDPAGPRTIANARYMRGMDGDKAATGTKTVTITNSLNETIPDSKQHQGFTRETQNYLDGAVIGNAINDPWSTAATGTDLNGVQSFVTGVGSTRNRAKLNATNNWRTTRSSTTYNDKGLPVAVQNDGDISDPTQATCTRTNYVANTTAWLLAYPSAVQKIGGTCADTNQATSASIISDIHHRYDGQAFGVAPTIGKVTQTDTLDTWPSGGAETFQNATKKTTYDSVYGRELTVTDVLGRTTTTTYTPTTGGPVTQVAVASPQVTIAGVPQSLTKTETYDPVSGLPIATVDGSGLRSDRTYDPLGRVTAIWAPGRSKSAGASANATFGYAVNTTTPSVVTSNRLLASGQYATTYAIVDGLGRTVQAQEPTSYDQGGRVVTDTQYDSQGRPWKTHNPYWNSSAPGGSLLVVQDNAVPNTTVTSYDSANRATASAYLLNGTEQWRTTTAYDGDRVTTIPPAGGTASTVITNGLGQKVQTLQYKDRTKTAPTDPADTTAYTYTKAGQLSTVKDATGQNTWTFTYDLRGQKTAQNDPDSGASAMTYDAAGQLLTTTDALGKKIAYAYDNLGRKTATYDTSTAGTKLTG